MSRRPSGLAVDEHSLRRAASEAQAERRYTLAIELWTEVALLAPHDPVPHHHLGDLHARQSDDDLAVQHFAAAERLYAVHGQDAKAHALRTLVAAMRLR